MGRQPDPSGQRRRTRQGLSPTTTVVGGTVLLVAGTAVGLGLAPGVTTERVPAARPAATASPSTTSPTNPADASSEAGPASESAAAPERQPRPESSAEPAEPVRFHSDRLDVTVPIRAIEADDGVLLPPGDPQQLGWWQSGAMPGAGRGRVLVTGHTVQAGGGAFDDLSRLRLGDVVAVRTEAGRHRYRVASLQYLTIEQFADRAPRLLRSTGPERLVLVTCDGWDGTGYEGSTVVIAEPV